MLNSTNRTAENRLPLFNKMLPNEKSTIVATAGSTTPATSPRALQQYHQSPFAIQQLLGLSSSPGTGKQASSPKNKASLYSPNHSAPSSVQTDTSNDALDSKLSNCEQSRASSSISVGSHGTLSPISSPKLHSPPLPGTSSLSVSNLVNSAMSPNFSPAAAYFPARHSPLSQNLLNHPAISTSGSFPGSDPVAAHSAAAARISYFNSPAAAAFMSAASMHVGLQQVNSMANKTGNGFTVGTAMFNPFNTDVAGKFHDKSSSNTGMLFYPINSERVRVHFRNICVTFNVSLL